MSRKRRIPNSDESNSTSLRLVFARRGYISDYEPAQH
jgi:hypothetical protein